MNYNIYLQIFYIVTAATAAYCSISILIIIWKRIKVAVDGDYYNPQLLLTKRLTSNQLLTLFYLLYIFICYFCINWHLGTIEIEYKFKRIENR